MTAGDALRALDGFDSFVQDMLEIWKVPGVAVTVLADAAPVLTRGYGLRDVAQQLPVTGTTLFAIGSATKAFTAASLALLVDEGRLAWDTPVRAYLPDFALYDPVASERITPRDLLCHRSGLPRHDLAWYGATVSRATLIRRLRYLPPSKDFRALWQYQNLMFMAAGHLVEQRAGMPWESFVQERLFAPLGIEATFSARAASSSPDCARPYRERHDEVREMPYYEETSVMAPAGAIYMGAEGLAAWLALQLHRGIHAGARLLSEPQMTELHAPQMVMPDQARWQELGSPTYALGWMAEPYRGVRCLHHGGNIDGFSTLVAFLPQHGIGVAVTANLDATPLPTILVRWVFDRLLGLEPVDWHGRLHALYAEFRAAEALGKERSAAAAVPHTQPSHTLADYAGEYAHPGYGPMVVRVQGDALEATFNGMTYPLTHYHYDTFEWVVERFDVHIKLTFATDAAGAICGVAGQLESEVEAITFVRQAENRFRDPAYLAQFTGVYLVLDQRLVVRQRETQLYAALPGQPEYELEGHQTDSFRVQSLPGHTLTFTRDAAGAVTGAVLSTPYLAAEGRRVEDDRAGHDAVAE